MLACSAGAVQAAPLEVYAKLPAMSQATISPDGSKVAFVQPVDGKQMVVVDQISPAAFLTGVPGTEQTIHQLIWADATHLLVVKSMPTAAPAGIGGPEQYLAQSLDVPNRKATPLLRLDTGIGAKFSGLQTVNQITGDPQPRLVRGRATVFVRTMAVIEGFPVPAFVSVDLTNSRVSMVERTHAGELGRDWIVDTQGEPLAQTSFDPINHSMSVRLRRGGTWNDAVVVNAANEPPSVVGLSPDGAALVLQISKDGGVEYRSLALAGGPVSEPIKDYEGFSRLLSDSATHRIMGGVRTGMESEYVFFDARDQATWTGIVKSFEGEDVAPVGWSDDHTKVLVQVTGLAHGVVYDLVDLSARKAMEIGVVHDGLKPDDMAEVHLATYPAADGRPIRSYLTLPNGREPKGLPMIVLAHDGPASRDDAGFDWWAQALASRGYAVLQPQFRGSSGFGQDLAAAGFGEWGRKMQSDLSDGVRALASKGIIDPKRVCIVGAGYGGYASLAGATFEQGVYRCAVSVAGFTDVRQLPGSVRNGPRFVGAKDPSDPIYNKISPVKHADQANAPILLIHGREDTVVSFDQSQKMADALNAAKKPVQVVVLKGDDHWLSREDTRLQMLQETVRFLEANNPPG